MKLKSLIKKIYVFLNLVIFAFLFICCNIKYGTVSAELNDNEINSEFINNFRYGYDVTAGRSLSDGGLIKTAPILKPISDDLYQYITKTNSSKTEAKNFISSNAVSAARQSSSLLNAGITAKISFVNLDVDAAFNTSSSFSSVYEERYEIYYEKITRFNYQIEDSVNLKYYVTDEFERDLYAISDENEAKIMLQKYGTHYFTGYEFGGLMQITNYQASDSSSIDLSQSLDLSAKISASAATLGGGVNFNFSEQYTQQENNAHQYSAYSCLAYGGNAVSGMTLDHLFTYNPSYVDGKGSYEYGRWVTSVNEEKNLAIMGVPSTARNIPLWDFLDDRVGSAKIKNYLHSAYIKMCGDKYTEYLEKYPTSSRTIEDEALVSGSVDVLGYSYTYKDNTVYKEDNNSTGVYNVNSGSVIDMNFVEVDTINPITKEWKIIEGTQIATVIDNQNGKFRVLDSAPKGMTFTVGLYDNDQLIYNRTFTVIDSKFSGGDGSKNSPYLISNINDYLLLCRETSLWGLNYRVTNNIDFDGLEISSIGEVNNPFTGTFDGNYCKLSNIVLKEGKQESIGLFAYNKGTIKNVFINNIELRKDDSVNRNFKYVGTLVGHNHGNIQNCQVDTITARIKSTITGSDFTMYFGGLAGYSTSSANENKSQISSCSVINIVDVQLIVDTTDGSIKHNSYCYAGGFIGGIDNSIISDSYVKNISKLKPQTKGYFCYSYAGGFIGQSNANVQVSNSVVGGTLVLDPATANADSDKDRSTTSKNSFVVKHDKLNLSNCYAIAFDEEPGHDNCIVKNVITYESCNTLSSEVWFSGENGFPELISQSFDTENSIVVDDTNAKKSFYYGEQFSIAGISLKVTNKGSSSPIEVNEFKYDDSLFKNNELGNHIIKVSALGMNATYQVNVRKIEIVGLLIEPVSKQLYAGKVPTLEDFTFMYILENGELIDIYDKTNGFVNYSNNTIQLVEEELVVGENLVTFKFGSNTETVVVDAIENKLVGATITKQPTVTEYYSGDNFNPTNLEITANYLNGDIEVITLSNLEIMNSVVTADTQNIVILVESQFQLEIPITIIGYNYLVTFKNYDGSIISETKYKSGSTIVVPSNITKPSDERYDYEFNGWDKEVSLTCNSDVVYTAKFNAVNREYTIIFKDYDGKVISEDKYNYGDQIIAPSNVHRQSDNINKYRFVGWNKNVPYECVKDETYYAVYESTPIEYKVVFKDYDGRIISEHTYNYGDEVVIPSNLLRPNDGNYSYEFIGWDHEVSAICKGNEIYQAVYEMNNRKFTIIFKNYDGSIISENKYEYGETINVPTNVNKPSDDKYEYIFIGWNKEVDTECKSNATYTAVYETKEIETEQAKSGCFSCKSGCFSCKNNSVIIILNLFALSGIILLRKKGKAN